METRKADNAFSYRRLFFSSSSSARRGLHTACVQNERIKSRILRKHPFIRPQALPGILTIVCLVFGILGFDHSACAIMIKWYETVERVHRDVLALQARGGNLGLELGH